MTFIELWNLATPFAKSMIFFFVSMPFMALGIAYILERDLREVERRG